MNCSKTIILIFLFSFSYFQQVKSQDMFSLIGTYSNKENNNEIMRIQNDGDTIYTTGQLTQKLLFSNEMLEVISSVNNQSIGTSYSGRDVKVSGDYVYVAGRANGYGDSYNKQPNISITFEKDITNEDNTFDNITPANGIVVADDGSPAPSLGFQSLSIKTNEKVSSSSAYVMSKYVPQTEKAYVNLWVKFNTISDKIKIPIFGYDNTTLYYLTAETTDKSNVFLGIEECNKLFINKEINISRNEWYNIKICVGDGKIGVWYRTKECGSWITLIDERQRETYLVDKLETGIQTDDTSANIQIDDIYYSDTDIDLCSYINGALSIYRKSDMELIDTYNLEIRCNSMAIYDKLLCVSCLRGVNFYDISTPSTPKLIHAFRKDKWWEAQGCDIYVADGKVYLFVTCYIFGNAIFDITDINNIRLIKEISFSDVGDYAKKNKNYSFDVVVDYPFAYCTFCVARLYQDTECDHRGVLTVDISDLENPRSLLEEYPSIYYPKTITDGDTKPCQITKCGNDLFMNNGIMGISHFKIQDNGIPSFVGCHQINDKSCVMSVKGMNDDILFVGDARSGDPNYPDMNTYVFKRYDIPTSINSYSKQNKYSIFNLKGIKLINSHDYKLFKKTEDKNNSVLIL